MGTYIVTGGSTGIGAALTRQLLAQGHQVVATGRSAGRLAEMAAASGHDIGGDVGDRLVTVEADAGSWPDTQRVVATTVEAFGRIDGVVANAGYTLPGNLRTTDPDDWPAMVLTNVLGPAYLVRAALEHLEASKGRVLVVGSVAGHKGSPGNLYSATKWATTGLTEAIRLDLAAAGVGVTLLSPGVVDTPFYPAGPPMPPITPEQVAATALFALSQPAEVDVNVLVVRPTGQAF